MKRYDWSLTFPQYLVNYMKKYGSPIVGLAAMLFPMHYKYEIDWGILAIGYAAFLLLLLAFIAYRHDKYCTDGYLEINDSQIKWRYGGEEHVFNIAGLRDIKLPKPEHFKKYGVDYFYLYFGDGQEIKLDPSFPNYGDVKKDLLERIVHHDELQFLQTKFRRVEA